MAREIKWQIRFKSLRNVDCKVNIYVEGYTGTPLQLTGGATPVYWEENDSKDLLKVVRTKTGYISFIEETFGQWSEVFPTTNIDRYVEVLYGTKVMFTGYLQAQSFENGWTAPPREIQIPIQSPLLAAQTLHFDAVQPQMITIAQAMKWAIDKIGAPYKYIEFPTTIRFNSTFRASMLSPYNESFNRSNVGEDTTVFTPVDIYTFIEGICNAYGLIVHDTPDRLIFMRFNAASNETYYRYKVSDLPNVVTPQVDERYAVLTFSDLFESASADNTESSILPLQQIVFNYNSEQLSNVDMDLGRCKFVYGINQQGMGYSRPFIALQQCHSNEITSNMMLTSNSINSAYQLSTPGVMIAAIAANEVDTEKVTSTGGILIQTSPSWANNKELARVRVPVPVCNPTIGTFTTKYALKMKCSWASTFRENFHTGDHGDFTFLVYFLYDDESEPSLSRYTEATISGENGELIFGNHSSSLFIYGNNEYDYMTVIIRAKSMSEFNSGELVLIENVGFEKVAQREFDILTYPPNDDTLQADNGSLESNDVSQFLTPCRYARNMLYADNTPAAINKQNYRYLLRSQKQFDIMARLKNGQTEPYGLYESMFKFTYQQQQLNARMLAVGFDPRNDIYTLILHTFIE